MSNQTDRIELETRVAQLNTSRNKRSTELATIDEEIKQVKSKINELRRKEAQVKEDELRASLEEEYGTEFHPKRSLLWSKAWEHGHSSGEADVRFWYGEMSELIL